MGIGKLKTIGYAPFVRSAFPFCNSWLIVQNVLMALSLSRTTRRLALVVSVCAFTSLFTALPCPALADGLADARKLLLTGKYDEAVAAYAELAANEPVAAAIGTVQALAATGKLDEARQSLETAAAGNENAAEVWAELAGLAVNRGDYAAATSDVEKCLELNENQLQARWWQAELHRLAGRLDDAAAGYLWLVRRYNTGEVSTSDELYWVGLGAAQHARWQRASDQFSFLVNELYPDALTAEAEFWQAHLMAGLLYLEKYNQAEASRELKSALAINPNAADVLTALARLSLQNFELDEANRLLDEALSINPKLLAAHHAKADGLLANFEAGLAIKVLEGAMVLNPVNEATLGRLAAAYAVVDGGSDTKSDTRFGRLVQEVLLRNPQCGEFFLALGTGLDQSRKFPLAARFYQEANQRMPQLIEPPSALGMVLMRLGDEPAAKAALDAAFEADPFHVRVNNSLKVLEVLDTYAVLETDHFVLRFDRGKDEILAKYMARYLEDEVYPELTAQFGFAPQGKSLFEVFSRAKNTSGHGWFSARMVGLPYIGTVGACAGKMVALASPNDMPQKYNWARVLKHEFVHVLNLQQSDFNIPHWFTEALAVQSEGSVRPQVWNELLIERVPAGKLFNLDTINLGFIRPASSLDWQMAYCQAQLYAQYMLATYGPDATARLLRAYADNLPTRAALTREFHVEQDEFERGYREFLNKVVAGLTVRPKPEAKTPAQWQRALDADPENPDLLAQVAQIRLGRKQYPQARQLAEKARAKQANHPLASYVLARVRLVVGESAPARELLEKALDRQNPHEQVLSLLAGMELTERRFEQAADLYSLGRQADPYNPVWLRSLARTYLTAGDNRRLREALAELAEIDADDVAIRKKLAELSLADRDFAGAARWAKRAVEVDCMDASVHLLWGKALAGAAEFPAAVEEFEVGVRLDPENIELHWGLAEALSRAGRKDQAKEAVQALLALDPNHAPAKALLETLNP